MPFSACCMPHLINWCPWNKASLLLLYIWLIQNTFHLFRPVAPPLKVGALERVVDKTKICYFTPSSSSVPPNVFSNICFSHYRCLNIASSTISLVCAMSWSKLSVYEMRLNFVVAICCFFVFRLLFSFFWIYNCHTTMVILVMANSKVLYVTLGTPWDNLRVLRCPSPVLIFCDVHMCLLCLYCQLNLNTIQYRWKLSMERNPLSSKNQKVRFYGVYISPTKKASSALLQIKYIWMMMPPAYEVGIISTY